MKKQIRISLNNNISENDELILPVKFEEFLQKHAIDLNIPKYDNFCLLFAFGAVGVDIDKYSSWLSYICGCYIKVNIDFNNKNSFDLDNFFVTSSFGFKIYDFNNVVTYSSNKLNVGNLKDFSCYKIDKENNLIKLNSCSDAKNKFNFLGIMGVIDYGIKIYTKKYSEIFFKRALFNKPIYLNNLFAPILFQVELESKLDQVEILNVHAID